MSRSLVAAGEHGRSPGSTQAALGRSGRLRGGRPRALHWRAGARGGVLSGALALALAAPPCRLCNSSLPPSLIPSRPLPPPPQPSLPTVPPTARVGAVEGGRDVATSPTRRAGQMACAACGGPLMGRQGAGAAGLACLRQRDGGGLHDARTFWMRFNLRKRAGHVEAAEEPGQRSNLHGHQEPVVRSHSRLGRVCVWRGRRGRAAGALAALPPAASLGGDADFALHRAQPDVIGPALTAGVAGKAWKRPRYADFGADAPAGPRGPACARAAAAAAAGCVRSASGAQRAGEDTVGSGVGRVLVAR